MFFWGMLAGAVVVVVLEVAVLFVIAAACGRMEESHEAEFFG